MHCINGGESVLNFEALQNYKYFKRRLYLLGHDHEMPYVHLGNLVRKE